MGELIVSIRGTTHRRHWLRTPYTFLRGTVSAVRTSERHVQLIPLTADLSENQHSPRIREPSIPRACVMRTGEQ